MVDGTAVIAYANIRGRSLRRTVGPVCRLAVGMGLVGWMMPVLVRCWKRCLDLVCEDVFQATWSQAGVFGWPMISTILIRSG